MSYPQLSAYLKAHTKLTEIEANKKLLGSLANAEEAEKVQLSVEQRMGPYMCDNTVQQAKNDKNSYLSVLQEYQKQMRVSSASQQAQYAKMKLQLEKKHQEIKQTLQERAAEWEKERQQLKIDFEERVRTDELDQLSKKTNIVQKQMQEMLLRLQQEAQICILQQQLLRRRVMNEIVRISGL